MHPEQPDDRISIDDMVMRYSKEDLDGARQQGIAEGRRETAEEVERICNAQHDAYQAGIAEGRRQATEGWEREWGAQSEMGGVETRNREDYARRLAARFEGARVVSRLVGPWEPVEQPEPARGGADGPRPPADTSWIRTTEGGAR